MLRVGHVLPEQHVPNTTLGEPDLPDRGLVEHAERLGSSRGGRCRRCEFRFDSSKLLRGQVRGLDLCGGCSLCTCNTLAGYATHTTDRATDQAGLVHRLAVLRHRIGIGQAEARLSTAHDGLRQFNRNLSRTTRNTDCGRPGE